MQSGRVGGQWERARVRCKWLGAPSSKGSGKILRTSRCRDGGGASCCCVDVRPAELTLDPGTTLCEARGSRSLRGSVDLVPTLFWALLTRRSTQKNFLKLGGIFFHFTPPVSLHRHSAAARSQPVQTSAALFHKHRALDQRSPAPASLHSPSAPFLPRSVSPECLRPNWT